jgi:hypothetical protein
VGVGALGAEVKVDNDLTRAVSALTRELTRRAQARGHGARRR